MAIINQRWPRDLAPETCRFSRTRNDKLQLSPATRQHSVIRSGRPLWMAECAWNLPNTDKLAGLRYYLEALDGFAGSVQIWNFASPYPFGIDLSTSDAEGSRVLWSYLGNRSPWTYAGMPSHWVLDATATIGTAAAAGETEIAVAGLDPSKIACVRGQYVQVGRRLYIATATAMVDSGGEATIPISPGLISAASVGDAVRLVEAGCEMRLAIQDFDESASAGAGMARVQATFIETVTDLS